MYRFHPQTAALLELIRDGAIGEVRHIDASFAFRKEEREGRLFDPATAGGGILDVGLLPGHDRGARSRRRRPAWRSRSRPSSSHPARSARPGSTSGPSPTWSTPAASPRPSARACAWRTRTTSRSSGRGAGSTSRCRTRSAGCRRSRSRRPTRRRARSPSTVRAPYALEADATLEAARPRRRARRPGMTLDESLAAARTLDRWRAAIGLRYPFEAEDADIPTVSGRPLAVGPAASMPYGEIPGVGKRMSRLVMGCDNQPDLAHASALFDHFVEHGGNAFDTAWQYGRGAYETRLGRWIANRGIREDLVMITKGAHTPHCDPESLSQPAAREPRPPGHRLRRHLPDAPRQPGRAGRRVRRRDGRAPPGRAASTCTASPTGAWSGSTRRTRTHGPTAASSSGC